MYTEDQDTLITAVALVAFFLCVITAIVISVRRSIKVAVVEEVVASPSNQLQADPVTQFVSTCEVCGNEATHHAVITGRSFFDRLPFISRLNMLHGMPWRYTVVDDWSRGRRLCAVHHTCAVQRLEQMHAQMRNDHSQFNAQQLQKIAMLDQGLIQLVREDQEEIKRTIGLRGGVRRSITPLRVYEDAEVVQLPAIATGKGEQ